MGTPLKNGDNYLFFPKGNYTGGKVTGMTNATVAVICTKRFIFIAPKKEMSSILVASRVRTFSFGDGVSMEEGLQKMLENPQMTLEQLESDLKDLLDADNHDRVIEISQLTHFKVHMLWILSQVRMDHKAGGATKVLSFGGPANMKKFKAFYFPGS